MSPSRLERLAYRMLGSVADAEDVVQEAHLRLLRQASAPEDEDAWLFRVVTNLALDKLRLHKRQRAAYPGPWLPEPMTTEQETPDGIAELAESLSLGFVLMLERLSPSERVVFVLREGFELSFADIGDLLGSAEASCRQRYRRARASLGAEPRYRTPKDDQRKMLQSLLDAVAARDYEAVVGLFAEDAVAYADGGGQVSAAIRPVTDPRRIAQVIVHLAGKTPDLEFLWQPLNGGMGLVAMQSGRVHSTVQLEAREGLITRLFVVRNPDKLKRVAPGAAG